MKRFFVTLLKIAISVAIIAYLVWQAREGTTFTDLYHQPKRWGMLVAAWFFCAGAVLTTLVRWHYLVRALEIPSRLTSSLRIGFVGYMFNLAPLGIVGGDAVKVVMLAREHKNTQAKSIASVVVDRFMGLYMLFVVAAVAIWVTGFWRIENPGALQPNGSAVASRANSPEATLSDATGQERTDVNVSVPDSAEESQKKKVVIGRICSITCWIAALGAVGIGLLMVPAVSDGRLVRAMERLPRVGRPLESLIDAMRMYRRRPGVLLLAAAMSVAVHSLFAIGVYCIACGLPSNNVHSLGAHFVMSPLSAATGIVPLPLGPFEAVLDSLYVQVPIVGAAIPKGQGLVVALGYRIITVLIASVGFYFYFSSRQEVARSIQQAGEEKPGVSGPPIAMSEKCGPVSAA